MPIYAIGDREPSIDPTAFVHPDAVIIGLVTVGPEASVWPTAVLRGDDGHIMIGAQTSIQDGTVIHATLVEDTIIGERCVVGHNAHLEGCVVEDACLIGSGSTVLNGSTVHTGALVGAGALVPPGTDVPAFAMALGVPVKIRENATSVGAFELNAAVYVERAASYRKNLRRLD